MAEKYRKKASVTLNFSGRLIILRMGDFCVLREFEFISVLAMDGHRRNYSLGGYLFLLL